ncbi:MAG: AsmA family protein, partial [Planctomycetota bacterium]|nr:AsmA family protein [Planctomycetota bacterium]
MRRWSFRILIAVVILLILVIAVTQAVLSLTNIPDRIVLTQVQQQLGLRMTAASVDTGWFGDTVLKDVTLALPLGEESLLATPELRVKHTWLPILIATRKVTLDRLTLEDAQLVVRQDAAGRWNLQDLVELLARTGGKNQAAATSTRRSGPKLPGLILHNATVTVTDKTGREAKLAPLEFSGLPEGLLVWRYEVTVPGTLKATGQMSPGFEWAHQVEFSVTHAAGLLKPWLNPWASEAVGPLNATGRWEGELREGAAVGRLTLEKLQAMGFDISGVVRARAGGGTARVEPQKLIIKTSQKMLPEVQVASGAIELIGTTVHAQRLQVSALAGMAQVDGRWSLDGNVGEITASWDEIVQAGGVRHGGRLSAAVSNTLGNRSVVADLNSSGAARGGRWRTQMKLTGGGRDWNEMNWTVAAPALSWTGPPRDVMLDGLVANLATRGRVLELTNVRLPSAERVAGSGSFDFNTQGWSLNLSGRGWPV